MHDAAVVGLPQGIRDLRAQPGDVGFREGAFFEPLRERSAFDEFHHEEVDIPLRIEVVHGGDVRMVQPRQGKSFPTEPPAGGRVGGPIGRQHLESDIAAQTFVVGAIYLTHAARAD